MLIKDFYHDARTIITNNFEPAPITKVNGIAYDWVNKNVYWTDSLYNWIRVKQTRDRLLSATLIDTGLDNPRGYYHRPIAISDVLFQLIMPYSLM